MVSLPTPLAALFQVILGFDSVQRIQNPVGRAQQAVTFCADLVELARIGVRAVPVTGPIRSGDLSRVFH
jgi:hypothetical protein